MKKNKNENLQRDKLIMIPENLITQLILSLLVVKTKKDFRSMASIISTFDICYLN